MFLKIRIFFMGFFFRSALGGYQWYRKWYGGRWEYWHVDVCKSEMWLKIYRDEHNKDYRPPSCFGTPIVEDYLDKGGESDFGATKNSTKAKVLFSD